MFRYLYKQPQRGCRMGLERCRRNGNPRGNPDGVGVHYNREPGVIAALNPGLYAGTPLAFYHTRLHFYFKCSNNDDELAKYYRLGLSHEELKKCVSLLDKLKSYSQKSEKRAADAISRIRTK